MFDPLRCAFAAEASAACWPPRPASPTYATDDEAVSFDRYVELNGEDVDAGMPTCARNASASACGLQKAAHGVAGDVAALQPLVHKRLQEGHLRR